MNERTYKLGAEQDGKRMSWVHLVNRRGDLHPEDENKAVSASAEYPLASNQHMTYTLMKS